MAYELISGVPGSGKTYFLVDKCLSENFAFNKDSQEYEKKRDVTIISNITGLRLEHIDIEWAMDSVVLQKAKRLAWEKRPGCNVDLIDRDIINQYYDELFDDRVWLFFNFAFQQRLTKKHGSIIYLIEECQQYFDKRFARKKWAPDVLFYFQKHRKLGHSIYMDTQTVKALSTEMVGLIEKRTHALPRTLSIGGELKYNEYVGTDTKKMNILPLVKKPKKAVKEVYQSMMFKETDKVKSPFKKWIMFFILFLIFAVWSMYDTFYKPVEAAKPVEKSESYQPKSFSMNNGKMVGRKEPAKEEPAGFKKWVKVSHVLIGERYKISDPVRGGLVWQELSEYPTKKIGSRWFVQLDKTQYELTQQRGGGGDRRAARGLGD